MPKQKMTDSTVLQSSANEKFDQIALEVALVFQCLDQLKEIELKLIVTNFADAFDSIAPHLRQNCTISC